MTKYITSLEGINANHYYSNGQYIGYSTTGNVDGLTHYYKSDGTYVGDETVGLFGNHFKSIRG